jgi:hypothetical protein
MIRTCQPTFSAALIGLIETAFAGDAEKNALCEPVPNPIVDTDWLRMLAVSTKNRLSWRAHPEIEAWLARSRLNSLFAAMAQVRPEETEKLAALKRFQDASVGGLPKLPQLLASLN